MKAEEKALEIKVGFFVLLGLGVIAYMVVQFGRLGEGLREYYQITVEFANASGLLKDSNVLLNGAKIGWVSTKPQITNDPKVLEETTGVVVILQIYGEVSIPEKSRFLVGSSGLLGDRFVDVIPPAEKVEGYLEPGTTVAGTRQPGIDDLTREGTDLIRELRNAVNTIDRAVSRVDEDILKEENIQDVEQTIKNLRQSTSALVGAGDRIDQIMDDAQRTVVSADEAMGSAKLAADDVGIAMKDARETIETIKRLIDQSAEGKGVIGRLLADEKLARDLEDLIANLKKHGILFYKDDSSTSSPPNAREDAPRESRSIFRSPKSPASRPGSNPAR